MKKIRLLIGIFFLAINFFGFSSVNAAAPDESVSSGSCTDLGHKPKPRAPRQPKPVKKNPDRKKAPPSTGFPKRIPKKPKPSMC